MNFENMKQQIPWIDNNSALPDPETACDQDWGTPGLIAAGADLSVARLHHAYSKGIFPWFSKGQPVLWWSPDPRLVLHTDNFKLHRSLRKTLQTFIASTHCDIRIDSDFKQVITRCAKVTRKQQSGTWIVSDMIAAYQALHAAGFAHSVETWSQGRMVGGLYCVSIGQALFGESMFALQTDASKIALAALIAFSRVKQLPWIDCQQNTKHLASLGGTLMPRAVFLENVRQCITRPPPDWKFEPAYWSTLLTPEQTT